jgi:hypothetical protein
MLFKEPIKKRISIALGIMIFGISILLYLLYSLGGQTVGRFAILFILGIELSWFLVCSGDDFFVSCFSFLSFVNIYIAIGFIGDTIASGLSGNSFVGMLILIRLSIFVLIFALLNKYVRPGFRKLVTTLDKEWEKAILIPFMFLVIQIVVLYYPQAYWYWSRDEWSRIIISSVYLLFIIVYYLLYIQASAIVEKYTLEKRQLLIAQQEKLWESEMLRLKVISTLASQQRHDLHHHNAVVMGLLQSGELKELMVYLRSFDLAIDAHNSSLYCANPVANSIINYYADMAKKENIKMTIEAMIPENIGIENIDLTCVLGNVLENAIEGCLRLPKEKETEIDVKIKYFDKRLRVRVENTCDQEIEFIGELPKTKKPGGGTGTRSIVYTAEIYDGTAGFTVIDNRFISQIVLNEK